MNILSVPTGICFLFLFIRTNGLIVRRFGVPLGVEPVILNRLVIVIDSAAGAKRGALSENKRDVMLRADRLWRGRVWRSSDGKRSCRPTATVLYRVSVTATGCLDSLYG